MKFILKVLNSMLLIQNLMRFQMGKEGFCLWSGIGFKLFKYDYVLQNLSKTQFI